MWSSKRNELDHLAYIKNELLDENFAERVDYYLRWYIIIANRTKVIYYSLSIANIVLPLVLNGINLFYWCDTNQVAKLFEITIPLIISCISSIITFCRFYDKWINYRSTITKIGIFLNKYIDAQKRENFNSLKEELHQEFNQIIKNESKEWIIIQKRKKNSM